MNVVEQFDLKINNPKSAKATSEIPVIPNNPGPLNALVVSASSDDHTAPPVDAPKSTSNRALDDQSAIDIEIDEIGNLFIVQREWPDDNSVVKISAYNIDVFIEALCDALGIGAFGGAR
jgi:hypothetical protein